MRSRALTQAVPSKLNVGEQTIGFAPTRHNNARCESATGAQVDLVETVELLLEKKVLLLPFQGCGTYKKFMII